MSDATTPEELAETRRYIEWAQAPILTRLLAAYDAERSEKEALQQTVDSLRRIGDRLIAEYVSESGEGPWTDGDAVWPQVVAWREAVALLSDLPKEG